MDEEAFSANDVVESAVHRQLGIIGEAVRRLTPEFKTSHANVNWRSWTDFRNVIVHAYDTLDDTRVWTVVELELNEFRLTAIRLIDELLGRPDRD